MYDIPSKGRFDLIPLTLEYVRSCRTANELAERIGEAPRHGAFLFQNACILGFLQRTESGFSLTEGGERFLAADDMTRASLLCDAAKVSHVISMLVGRFGSIAEAAELPVETVAGFLEKNTHVSSKKKEPMKESTAYRRASSVKGWLSWLCDNCVEGPSWAEEAESSPVGRTTMSSITGEVETLAMTETLESCGPENAGYKIGLKVEVFTLHDFLDLVLRRAITTPRYQRGFVWSRAKKMKLIDSMALSYPIGTLLLYLEGGRYKVIDGLQRIETLKEFLNNPTRFARVSRLIDPEKCKLAATHTQVEVEQLQSAVQEVLQEKSLSFLRDPSSPRVLGIEVLTKLGKQLTIETLCFFEDLLRAICEFHDRIMEYRIPVIVLERCIDQLPEIFNRINTEGTQLTKYQIFAATWHEYGVSIPRSFVDRKNEWMLEVVDHVRAKYAGWQIEGLDLDFRPDDISMESLNLFEFLLGFGTCLEREYPFLAQKDGPNPICGFLTMFGYYSQFTNSYRTVMGGDFPDAVVRSVGLEIVQDNRAETWNKNKPRLSMSLVQTASRIYWGFKQIDSVLGFLPRVRISNTASDHALYHIACMVNWLARRYDDVKSARPADIKILQRYVYDILADRWIGSGDRRLFEQSSNDNYLRNIAAEEWNNLWDSIRIGEEQQLHTRRVSLKGPQHLLLKLVYARFQSIYDSSSRFNYSDDHIFAVSKMKTLYATGGPLNHIGNRSLILDTTNIHKMTRLPHEFVEEIQNDQSKLTALKRSWAFEDESLWKQLMECSKIIGDWLQSQTTDPTDARNAYMDFVRARYRKMVDVVQDLMNHAG